MSRSIEFGLNAQRFRFGRAASVEALPDAGPKIAFRLLILFLMVLYSSIAQVYPATAAFRPAMVIAVGAIFMMIVELAMSRQSFRLAWPQSYMLLALSGVAVVSTVNAFYVPLALTTTMEFAKILVMYVVMENTITSERRIRTVLLTLAIGGMFPAVGSIVYYFQGKLVEGSRAAWEGVFANPNEAAYALVILVPIAAALSIGASLWQRLVFYGVIATYLFAIYLTFSRGGLLGLFAVIAMFGWKQKSLVIRVLMIAVLIIGLITVSLFWTRKDNFDNIAEDTTFNQRIATIMAGLNMFQANPLFGVGPGCSLVAYPVYVPPELHCGCQEMLMIHNSFVQALSELGAFGFIPWMVLIGVSLFQAWRIQQGKRMRAYGGALELALWGFVVCSLSGGFTYSWFPYILVALVVATKRVAETGSESVIG